MNVTEKAKKMIAVESKTWLSDKLGITRATLDKRLEKENWKKTETQVLLLLNR